MTKGCVIPILGGSGTRPGATSLGTRMELRRIFVPMLPSARRQRSFAKLIARCVDPPADGHARTAGEKRPRGRPGAPSSGLSRRPPSPHGEGCELCNDKPSARQLRLYLLRGQGDTGSRPGVGE